MARRADRRRWLQFGLKSLLLSTVLCAVAVTWWRHWKQSAELAALQEKLQRREAESEYQDNLVHVFSALDVENPEHRQAYKTLRCLSLPWPANSLQKKSLGDLEILVFHSRGLSIPGSVDSVAALLRDHELVDIVARESYTRTEWHDMKLQDSDDDGRVEVVVECHPGVWSDSEPFSIAYKISNDGFVQVK